MAEGLRHSIEVLSETNDDPVKTIRCLEEKIEGALAADLAARAALDRTRRDCLDGVVDR